MRFKNAVLRSVTIIIILFLSCCVGFLVQNIWDKVQHKNYPQEFSEIIEKYSDEYGVPEYIIYSIIKEESEFASNLVSENGDVGLMQISPSLFEKLTGMLRQNLDTGLLYDPDTNIKYGTYYLSYLYVLFGDWNLVYGAKFAGSDVIGEFKEKAGDIEYAVDSWQKIIPAGDIYDYVLKINQNIKIYKDLYYDN